MVVATVMAVVVATGCQTARAGTRCRPGASPARDATHVLFCVNGRWKRTVTIGQAAQIVVSTTPKELTPINPSVSLPVGTNSNRLPIGQGIGVRLTALNGAPLGGREVTFSIQSSGQAGGSITGSATTTAPDGVAWVSVLANARGGTYTVLATSSGLSARVAVTNLAGPPGWIARTGGGGQIVEVDSTFPQPLSGRVFDAAGSPLGGVTVSFDESPVGAIVPIAPVVTDADGSFSAIVRAGDLSPNASGLERGQSFVEARAGNATTTYALRVLPGPVDDASVENGEQSAPVLTSFPLPIVVTAVDRFDNGVGGVGVTFNPIAGPSGASGVAVQSSVTTDEAGEAATSVSANGTAGTWTLRVTVSGLGTLDLPMTNTP